MTIDDDVASRLKAELRASGLSLKELINQLLRRGLEAGQVRTSRRRFRVRAKAGDLRPGVNVDCIGELLHSLETGERR